MLSLSSTILPLMDSQVAAQFSPLKLAPYLPSMLHPYLLALLSKITAVTDDDITTVAPLHNHHPVPNQFPQVSAVEGSSSSTAESFANGIMLRWQVESQHPRYHQEAVVVKEKGQLCWQRGREGRWRNRWTRPAFRNRRRRCLMRMSGGTR
ncbi:uncharacterized protein DS421_1g04920 [Arachis hypogaea]|nr:uncharacterized protein DS421_1g04920 [Arachis hypogaea]